MVMTAGEIAALIWLFDGSKFKIGGEQWSKILNPIAGGIVYYYWMNSHLRRSVYYQLSASITPDQNGTGTGLLTPYGSSTIVPVASAIQSSIVASVPLMASSNPSFGYSNNNRGGESFGYSSHN